MRALQVSQSVTERNPLPRVLPLLPRSCRSLGKLDICFEKTIAEKLPKKFFDCNLDPPQPEPLLNVDCQGLDQPSCSKTKGCVWCVSAAVRSACYAEEEASRLPPAVFKCTHPTIFEFSRLGVQ